MTIIIGATGQLGTAFRSLIPDGRFLVRSDLDLDDLGSVRPTIEALAPTAIINCAAFTAVDAAEADVRMARTVNGLAVGELAGAAESLDVPFVTFSTNYVFDGGSTEPYVESDPTAPINEYGASKVVGEVAALSYVRALVIRTSWVISGTHQNFVATMIRLARRGPVRVVDDQVGCPTVVGDLAAATVEAMKNGVTGLLHLTNEGSTTWFGLATAAVAEAGLPVQIEACTTSDFPTPAPRPAYSVLGSERSDDLGLKPLPHWRESLPEVIADIHTWL